MNTRAILHCLQAIHEWVGMLSCRDDRRMEYSDQGEFEEGFGPGGRASVTEELAKLASWTSAEGGNEFDLENAKRCNLILIRSWTVLNELSASPSHVPSPHLWRLEGLRWKAEVQPDRVGSTLVALPRSRCLAIRTTRFAACTSHGCSFVGVSSLVTGDSLRKFAGVEDSEIVMR